MKHSQEGFLDLVNEAYQGTLQLPAFQRDWRWERTKVISLYDSLRKQFPIGAFLFLEPSLKYDLSPRPYEGSLGKDKPLRLTLDGQQRITSGIILLHGASGSVRYFLNLSRLKQLAEQYRSEPSAPPGLDYRNADQVKKFVQHIDDGDGYMIATKRKTELNTLLLQDHLLSSIYLSDKGSTQKALEPYEEKYHDTMEFLKYVVVPHFTMENDSVHPITTLTASESLSAVTKIFATINTTGKRLTPIEIVTAVLFAHEVNLKQQVQEYRQASNYLGNMDSDGEVLLQTIALLADKSPKKSMLPDTISFERFKTYYEEAADLLDKVGHFLTLDMGAGLKDTGKLVPYGSILAPMAICMKEMKDLKGVQLSSARDKMQKWFVGAAIAQRYTEGAGSKQESDAKDMRRWIRDDNPESMPVWLKNVHIAIDIKTASPNGAVGSLLRCLINRKEPLDPLECTRIGYYEGADGRPEDHHIWATRFCTRYVGGWDKNKDTSDHALNLIPVSSKTNSGWANVDPKNQMDAIKAKHKKNAARRKEILEKLLLSDECVEVLERPNKTRKDYNEFLDARFKVLCAELAKWDFTLGEEEYDEDEAGDDSAGS